MKAADRWIASAPDNFFDSNGYKVSADVRNSFGFAGSYGLLFDVNGDGVDFWFKTFEISENGSFSIMEYDTRSGWALLTDGWSNHILPGTSTNRLSVKWFDSTISAYVNGQHLTDYNAGGMQPTSAVGVFVLSEGQPGLEVIFDDYLVEDPTCDGGSATLGHSEAWFGGATASAPDHPGLLTGQSDRSR